MRSGRSDAVRSTKATLVALAVAIGLLAAPGALAAQEGERTLPEGYRVGGEYGLWVRQADGELEVRWVTVREAPGFLEASAGGETVAETTTEAGSGHAAAFEVPEADSVVLRYGARGDTADTHRTVVHLPVDRQRAPVEVAAPDTFYVVGDVHGEYETLLRLLHHTGLVDGEGRWAGGDSHLVLLGDLTDRGQDVTKTLWFLYGLEREARAAGGRVHVVLGNHETMIWSADTRYTAPKEKRIARIHGATYPRLFDVRTSVLGKWLISKPAVLKLDDVLLAHGGVGPAYLDYSLQAFDDSMAQFTSEPLFHRFSDETVEVAPMDSAALWRRIDFFMDEESVFWYRGYLRADTLRPVLDRLLEKHGADRHVVAHTALERVTAFYGGDVIGVDLRDPATELLMMVREGEAYTPYRWPLEGGPEALPAGEPKSEDEEGYGPGG